MKHAVDSEIVAEAKQQISKNAAPELGVEVAQMNICAGSPIPAGWILVNDFWSPTSCGNPTSIVYNVWVIERYSDKPVGSVMNVCAGAQTPTGWVEINSFWSPTSCGHPTYIVNNVKQIKRVQ